MRYNRPTYIISVGMGKERKIVSQVVAATAACVIVKTCVQYNGEVANIAWPVSSSVHMQWMACTYEL